MQYRHYKTAIKRLRSKPELESLLHYIENDFDNITDRQYEILRYCILKKIYIKKTFSIKQREQLL